SVAAGAGAASVLGPAAALGLGVLGGHLLSFEFTAEPPIFDPIRYALTAMFLATWTAVLVAGSFFILRWMGAAAHAWLRHITTIRRLRMLTWSSLALAALLAASWFATMLAIRDTFEFGSLRLSVTVLTAIGPLLIIGAALFTVGTPPALVMLTAALAF